MKDNCERLEIDAYCDDAGMTAWRAHAEDCEDCAAKVKLYETLVGSAKDYRTGLTPDQRNAVLRRAEEGPDSPPIWKPLLPIAAGIAIALGLIFLWPTGPAPDPGTPGGNPTVVVEEDQDLEWEHHQVRTSRKRLNLLAQVMSEDEKDPFPTVRDLRNNARRRKKYFGTHWTETKE